MKVDITSMFFNSSIDGQTATPAWRTSLGQNKTKECRIETDVPGVIDIIVGMTYKIVSDISKLNMSGISGNLLMCSVFDKIYVNSVLLPNVSYTLLLLKETSQSHDGRMQLCYSPHIKYDGKSNTDAINQIRSAIGCTPQGCWFVYDISIKNQDELHFSAKVVDPANPKTYTGKSQQRSKEWKDLIDSPILTIDELAGILKDLYEEGKKAGEGVANIFFFGLKYADCILTNNYKTKEIIDKSGIGASFQAELDKAIKLYLLLQRKGWSSIKQKANINASLIEDTSYLPYLAALRTKPFMLLAGISGTGKSRIVRKLAQATNTKVYENEADRWNDNRPDNFELIQVKPNWHNSMDVVGFYSNISKKYEFTPFVEFIVKAWQHTDTPYFLCLDEMNLAPVEEYFAEFLSAIESRSVDEKGNYTTDPIIKPFKNFGQEVCEAMLKELLGEARHTEANPLAVQFTENGLTRPPNLMVMGTVNMDETTFSFSRKVLDRAMSVEMNEVNYDDFVEGKTELMPLLTAQNELLVNRPQKALEVKSKIDSDKVIAYLKAVNALLDGTPFKLGYRAANEAMLYVSACKDLAGEQFSIGKALDEFTLMKILSRIEGDDNRLSIDEKDARIEAAEITGAITDNGEQSINLLNCLRAIVRQHIGQDTATEKKINSMYSTLSREHFVSYWG